MVLTSTSHPSGGQ